MTPTPHIIDPVEEAVVRNYHMRRETIGLFQEPAQSLSDTERELDLALIESVMVAA